MAAATKNIGFGVTVATTYEQPYHLARRLSTVDHLTGGRLGWNIVTGYLDSAARNLGHTEQPSHDERYAIAEEYVDVTYKLWYVTDSPSLFDFSFTNLGNHPGAMTQSNLTVKRASTQTPP